MSDVAPASPWLALRRYTSARIALPRTGASLTTAEVLRFGLDHARARDAVHVPLDTTALASALRRRCGEIVCVHGRAPDRATYLLRPDLGRRLDEASGARLASAPKGFDLVFVAADGLSAIATQRHVAPLLDALRPRLAPSLSIGPLVVALQARVALGDEIGALLGARLVVMLIGERPGLSAPDSLGAYLTYAPRIGRVDSERNCISNMRPEGLPYADAAAKLAWLIHAAFERGLTGIGLKENSRAAVDQAIAPPSPDPPAR